MLYFCWKSIRPYNETQIRIKILTSLLCCYFCRKRCIVFRLVLHLSSHPDVIDASVVTPVGLCKQSSCCSYLLSLSQMPNFGTVESFKNGKVRIESSRNRVPSDSLKTSPVPDDYTVVAYYRYSCCTDHLLDLITTLECLSRKYSLPLWLSPVAQNNN